MQRYNRDKSEGSIAQGPTQTFEGRYDLELGAFKIEVLIWVLYSPATLLSGSQTKPRDCGRYGIPQRMLPFSKKLLFMIG